MNTSPAHPPTPVKPAISSFTGRNDGETSLSSALAETVASLACFASPSRLLDGVDPNGSVTHRSARLFNDTSRVEVQAARAENKNSLESSHDQFLLDLSLRISASAEENCPPQCNSQDPEQEIRVNSSEQGRINDEKDFLNANDSTELTTRHNRKDENTEETSLCTLTALSLVNKSLTCQEPTQETKSSVTKATLSFDQHSSVSPSHPQNDAKKTIRIQEPTLNDSLSHTVASLATLSNFATPNRKPTVATSSTPTATSRASSNVGRHARSLSGPIVSGTAFSAVVALQNKGIGSDASVNSCSKPKNCVVRSNTKTAKEEGNKSCIGMPVTSSSCTTNHDSMKHPTAALEQIAMISDSISRVAAPNYVGACNTKLESKKRPSPYSKLATTNFSKKALTRCSDGAPIIAGTAAAAMAIATAARIATTNSGNGNAKLMHGFGVVEDDATLDRVVSLSTRAVLGISGECNSRLVEREKAKKYTHTPKGPDPEKATRVTPEDRQSNEEENLSSCCLTYQVYSSQPSQPLHHNASSSSTISSQPASFLHSSTNKNGNTIIGGVRGVGGMDILADIICHAPPMVVPQPSSASASGVYSVSHNSLHPEQRHHDCYSIPSHQEIYHETTSVHYAQQHQQLQTGISIPAIPSYQEIYKEMGIAPQSHLRSNDPSMSFYQHHPPAKVFKAGNDQNRTFTLYSMKEIRYLNSPQSEYSHPNCDLETTPSDRSNNNIIDSSAQSQARLMSTHYGHALSGEVEEGKELYTRKDLVVTGGHMLEHKDVHGSMKEGADSVVLCNLERDIREGDGLCWFLYSCDRNNGGGALCRSYHKKRAIRVFRSSLLGGRYAPPYLDEDEDDEIGYRYDGLYMVRAVWDINGNETESFPCAGEDGWQTYFFTRLPKKPLDGKTEPGIQYNAMGLQELWGSIQKMRGVRKPKKFEIPPAPMKLPPLKRAAISGDNKDRKVASYRPQKVQANEHTLERCDDSGKKHEEETSANSCDEETSEQVSTADCKSETAISSRQEKSPHVISRPIPNKVVTPRPRISSDATHLTKSMSSTLPSHQKRTSSAETSDSSDSETETSAATPKRMKIETPQQNTLSAPKRPNNLAQVISTLLPKRATAAKAEAANRDMFGKKKKRPYNRKSTSAPSSSTKLAKQSSKSDDTSSSSSVDNIDPNVLTIGSRVLVLYKGSLFKATIRKRRKNKDTHDFQIHYDGNKKSNVHWVPIDRIHEILSIAIDTAPIKKLDGNKSKRSGGNKKKSESAPEESDCSDDEDMADKESYDMKNSMLNEASEDITKPDTNATEPEPMQMSDIGSDDINTSTINQELDNSDEEQHRKDLGVVVPNERIVESVSPSEDPILLRMECHESNDSGSTNGSGSKKNTVFDNVKVLREDTTPSSLPTSMLNNDEAKVSLEKSPTVSSYDDKAVGIDADRSSDKEISDSSSEREDAKEQEAGDPTSELKFPLGAHVYVEYRRIFYSSTVLQARRKRNSTEYLVHYEGYKKASDRWVKENDLREVNAETTLRFEEQRIVSSNIAFDSDLSGPSDYSMTTRQKTNNTDNHVHHHFTREKPPRRARSDTSDIAQLEDIESGVAFLPGSVVFVEWNGALYLAKMVKKRFTGDRTEYLVSYDGYDSDHDAWISIQNIYEVNPQTKRVFNRMNAEIKSGGKLRKPDPPITRVLGKKKRESSSTRSNSNVEQKPIPKEQEPHKVKDDEVLTYTDPPLPRRRETRKTKDDESVTPSDRSTKPSQATSRLSTSTIDMQGIPSGVEFLPGSTLFAERKGCLCVAKMLKKRGKGQHMEYFVQFNDGTDDSESIWISTALVYEINPQTKRVFRQLSKKSKL